MKEIEQYRMFTKPAELHKSVNTLRGLVAGIKSDESVSSSEITELVHWCELHANLQDRHPFSEILPVLESVCADGIITEDESKDIIWLCSNFADSNSYYDAITSSIQFLSGLVHGIMADGKLDDSEISALKTWVDTNGYLAGTYPFDELNSMLYTILADKRISAEDREQLMAFFGNIIEFKDSYNLAEHDFEELRKKYSIAGICALCPNIKIGGHTFCFTGASYRGTRSELALAVENLGGKFSNNMSSKTDYLVVGNAGSPCWAYACYGRKIEEATNLRKNGEVIVIVNETDFWDAVDRETQESEAVVHG